jgi:hypothetical protein
VNSENAEYYENGYRVDSTNPSRIYINKQRPLMFGYMTRVALTEMNIQWGTPNVNNYNNTLTIGYYNNLGQVQGYVRITIPVGFYTAPRLGRVLASALNANATLTGFFGDNTFSVSVGGLVCGSNPLVAGQTKIATDSNFTIKTDTEEEVYFSIIPYNRDRDPLVVPVPYTLSKLQDDLTNMMGLTPARIFPEYYSEITGGYASMLYTPYIDVVSNFLTKNQSVKDDDTSKRSTGSLLARVYLANEDFQKREISITYNATASGEFIASTDNSIGASEGCFRREFKYPKQVQWNSTENIDLIDIEVIDYKGNPLFYLPLANSVGTVPQQIVSTQRNTADLQFTLQITEV